MLVLLIVRDSEARLSLREILARRGHRVHEAPDLAAALELAERNAFPLILFDAGREGLLPRLVRLRGLTGSTGSLLVALVPGRQLRVVEALVAEGLDDYLAVPGERRMLAPRLTLLERRVEALLESRRWAGRWESEAGFRLLVETMNEGLGVRDETGTVVYANDRLCEMLDYRPEELIGKSVVDIVHPRHRDLYRGEQVRRQRGLGGSYELVMAAKDGRAVYTLQSAKPLLDAEGSVVGSFAVITDISEAKRVERRLRLTQFTVDRAADAVFWTGPDGRLLYVNDAACRSLGYTREELLELSVPDVDADFPHEHWPVHWERVRREGGFTVESRFRAKDGRIFPVEVTVNYVEFEGYQHHVAVARDITGRKQAEELLIFNALHDPLTGLPNRAMFMDRLRQRMDVDRRRRNDAFAVLFLDLDRFKGVNDSLGHAAGDELLIQIARRLREEVRAPDLVARLGGDEFLVLLEGQGDSTAAIEVAGRFRQRLEQPFVVSGHEISTTVSIGIALFTDRHQNAEALVRDADTAMYRVKSVGGDGCVMFDEMMPEMSDVRTRRR